MLWTATAVCFEASSRRLGSLAVNVLRLAVAAALFTVLSLVRSGGLVSAALSQEAWFYPGLSGLVGFVLGDVFLFQAFYTLSKSNPIRNRSWCQSSSISRKYPNMP